MPAPALPAWPRSTDPLAHPSASDSGRRAQPAPVRGRTYGGSAPLGAGQLTVALPESDPLENSGSLTGHILAHGRADRPEPRSSTTKVLAIGLVLLFLLVAVGLLAATAAGDAVSGLFGGFVDD